MKEKLKGSWVYMIPFLFYGVTSIFLTKSYNDESLKRLERCLNQAEASNLPDKISFCSAISSASDWAYSSATAYFNPIMILLLIFLVLFGEKIYSMNKELNELKEKINV